MSTAARCTLPRPAVLTPPPDSTLVKLQADLTSARSRNRTLMRELTRAAAAPTVVSVLPGKHVEFDHTVFLSNGIRLEHRWTAETGWRYIQASTIPGTLAAIVDGVFAQEAAAPAPREALDAPVMYGGMAVAGVD